jgi:AAA15 family ATPase/GTPase
MKLEYFKIKNYRSIKSLKLNNLGLINVIFGKNNVGKSNVLRALQLAFFVIRNDHIFLSDTMFFNRNVYIPIEVELKLILEKNFFDVKKFKQNLENAQITLLEKVNGNKELNLSRHELDNFLSLTQSFVPLNNLLLKANIKYDDETSMVEVVIIDYETKSIFNYSKYRSEYNKLMNLQKKRKADNIKKELQRVVNFLTKHGVAGRALDDMERVWLTSRYDEDMFKYVVSDVRRHIDGIENDRNKKEANIIFNDFRELISKSQKESPNAISEIFGIIKSYFDSISDNYILIPNKEYFPKAILKEEGGERIVIFDTNKFLDRLSSLIESPSKKERELIQKFTNIFNTSYSKIGKLESITKFRKEVLAVFGSNLISLPIQSQGLGIQDLFIYLAHMILFDSAIVAI